MAAAEVNISPSGEGLSALSADLQGNNKEEMTQTLRRPDEQLKAAVIQELQWISSVDSEHIRVRVDEGAVTLTGTVTTYPETLLAAKAALTVRGVTAIAQELNVAGPFAEGSDTDIARQAGHALENAVNIPATVKV